MATQTYSYIAFHSTTKKAELEGHLSLDNLKSRLRKLDVERLKIVHFLFMRHHIDFCSYSFEDEWLLDGYCMCYNDWLSQQESDEPCPLDGYVIDVLKEWKGMIGEDEQVLAQHLLPFVDEVKALILKNEPHYALSE